MQREFAYAKAFAPSSSSPAETRNVLLVGGSAPIRFQARKLAGFVEIELPK